MNIDRQANTKNRQVAFSSSPSLAAATASRQERRKYIQAKTDTVGNSTKVAQSLMKLKNIEEWRRKKI